MNTIPDSFEAFVDDPPDIKYKVGDIVWIPFNGASVQTTITEIMPLKRTFITNNYRYYQTAFTGEDCLTEKTIFDSKRECENMVLSKYPRYNWGTFTTNFGQFRVCYEDRFVLKTFSNVNVFNVIKIKNSILEKDIIWTYEKPTSSVITKKDIIKRFVLDYEEETGLEFNVLNWNE